MYALIGWLDCLFWFVEYVAIAAFVLVVYVSWVGWWCSTFGGFVYWCRYLWLIVLFVLYFFDWWWVGAGFVDLVFYCDFVCLFGLSCCFLEFDVFGCLRCCGYFVVFSAV